MRKLHGRMAYGPFEISIENERGSVRRGKDRDGHEWASFMHCPYGYIRSTEGTDGDHVDCYIGPFLNSQKVFVVHQNDPVTKAYDEDKVMLAFNTAAQAKAAYMKQYDRPGFFGSMKEYTVGEFQQMLKEKRGVKLKKALRPVRRMVTRGGKTFMTTVYVGSTKKERREQAKRTAVTTETRPLHSVRSTVKLMKDQRKVVEFAPHDASAVDKVLQFQEKYFAGQPKPSMYEIVEAATEEVTEALKNPDSGADWYQESMARTRAIMTTQYPDMASDTEWDFFLSMVAVLSPTTTPSVNFQSAVAMYDHYKKTGDISTLNPRTGKAYTIASTGNAERFKEVLGQFPSKKDFVAFVNGVSDSGDLRDKYGAKISGQAEEAAFNSMVFGEKVGMFYQSMRGTEGAVTVDKWAIRSFYRWSGMLKEGTQSGAAPGERIRAIHEKMGTDERKATEHVMQTVGEKLGLASSQVQSVMWYYEKRLYEKLGWKGTARDTADFADAAEKVFMTKSLTKSEFQKRISALIRSGKMPSFEKFLEAIMAVQQRTEKAMPDYMWKEHWLIKSQLDNEWHCYFNGKWHDFEWLHPELMKAEKRYYAPEEIKALGMRWVTIRGARVLLKPSAEGGWVVVGGAGGKLSHMKIGKILGEEAYAEKRRERAKQGQEKLRELSPEEREEIKEKRRVQQQARKELRTEYQGRIQNLVGKQIEAKITEDEMKQIQEEAEDKVRRKRKRELQAEDKGEVHEAVKKETKRRMQDKVRKIETNAKKVLMADYLGDYYEPGRAKEIAKEIQLDPETAKEVLKTRRQFKKAIKQVGLEQLPSDKEARLKIGEVFAGNTDSLDKEVTDEIENNIETARNIEFYNKLDAQTDGVVKHIDGGAAEAANGILGDIYEAGAVFNADIVRELGVEAVARVLASKIELDGRGEEIKEALTKFSAQERLKTVDKAMAQAKDKKKMAEMLRDLAREKNGAPIYEMATANGHAIRHLVSGQQALGTAAGSLRMMAHIINALDDPPNKVIQIDMGKDHDRGKRRLERAGLKRGQYSMKKDKQGRYVAEIPGTSILPFFEEQQKRRQNEKEVDKIKMHKSNSGWKPEGMKDNIKLQPSQEAGLRLFKEQHTALLDYEAGLGKTPIALGAASEMLQNMGAKKVLVTVPAKLRDQMGDEAKKFLKDDMAKQVHVAKESMSPKQRQALYERPGVHVISHDALRNDRKFLKDAGYSGIIVDEIHKLTNSQKKGATGRYNGLMEFKDLPYKIGMSGTNIKSHKREMYKKVNFLNPNHGLGSMESYEKRYQGVNQGTTAFHASANDAFRKEIARYSYTQKAHLPVKNTTNVVNVEMSPDQRSAWSESEEKYKKEKARGVKGAAARRDSRNYKIIHEMDNHPKAQQITKLMRDQHPDEKAVVHTFGIKATQEYARSLEAEFGNGSVGVITGDTKSAAARRIKKSFNDPEGDVKFIVGTSAIEEGHNLQGGTVNFHGDLPETNSARLQREKRTHRRGQTNDVTTYVLRGANPYDISRMHLLDIKGKEAGVMGNPQAITGLDEGGFLSILNKMEAKRGATEAA